MDYEIEIEPSGVKYLSSSEDTILNSALGSGSFLAHSCKKGACGLCVATILSGSVKNEHNDFVSEGKVLTCSSYPNSDLTLHVEFFPELSDVECLTMPCKVVACNVANDIVILTLRYPPTVNFKYLSGQYIDLIYKGVRRSYSIANAYGVDSGIELHMRLIPGGEMSQLLANGCGVNQLMSIEGPKGSFFVRNALNPIIFLAGGTGFAPIKAMVESLLHQQVDRSIYIYWGMVNSTNFYTDIALSWARENNQVHYIPVVSGPDGAWSGCRGLVHEAVMRDFSDLVDYHVYACGSPLMIQSAKEAFTSQGLHADHFFADIFVPSK